MELNQDKEKAIKSRVNAIVKALPEPSVKVFALTFVSTFGVLWGLVESLNAFGLFKIELTSLGLYGFLTLLGLSLVIAIFVEFVRLAFKYHGANQQIFNIFENFLKNAIQYEIITDADTVIQTNTRIVEEAQVMLAITGSRSRDREYLSKIERALRERPKMVHYRVLYGEPHHDLFKTHLKNLLLIRNPSDRTLGEQKLNIGIFEQPFTEPEKFVCANEKEAIIILPSIHAISKYDTALHVTDPNFVKAMIQYVRSLYNAGKPIETKKAISDLKIIRPKDIPSAGK